MDLSPLFLSIMQLPNFGREALAIVGDHRLKAMGVVAAVELLRLIRTASKRIQVSNGSGSIPRVSANRLARPVWSRSSPGRKLDL